jgi:AcrR family transcriptional regulator
VVADVGTRAEAQRRRVLQAAGEIFGRRGYRATSMIEVASEVGLAKPTLYHYFKNKEVLDESLARALATVAAAPTSRAALHDLIVDRVRHTCEHQQLLKVCFEEEEELPAELAESILGRRRAFEDVWMATVDSHLAATGDTLAMSPRVWVNTALGAANWVYKWYRPAGPETPDQLGGHIADLLLGPFVSP